MVMAYHYKSVGTTSFDVDLGTSAIRLGSIQGFSEKAEHLAVGTSNVIIDNPLGTVGHSSDQIIGLQLFTVTESDCPAGNRLLYMSYIGTREYGRGSGTTSSLRTGVANEINVSLFDLNSVLGFRVIPKSDTTAKRPIETVGQRLTWILGTDYLTGLVADNGLVVYPDIGMDAVNYQGQRPTQVINDCELAASYFAFVYPDETQTVIGSLFFDDANASTAYSTSLRLTNVLADVDNVTTFAVELDFKLRRSPDDVGSGSYLPYARGARYDTRAATAAVFGYRDLIAPNANVKSSTAAARANAAFLWNHHTEDDRLTGTVKLPSAYVNNLRAGQRLQVKFTNLPGYTGWTWVRCLARAPGQREETEKLYQVAIELSPQEANPPVSAIVQTAVLATTFGGGTATFLAPVTPGNLLVYMGTKRKGPSPGPGPNAPNTDVALPRWGAGAWTDSTPATVRVEWDDPRAYQEGMKVYTKIADSASASCYLDEYTVSCCWEISGATMAGATFVYQTLQTFANVHAIGSLGSPAAGTVALLMLSLGPGGADPVPANVALNPGVWIRDIHGDGYGHTWDSNSNNGAQFNEPAPPETWIGHTNPDGSALAATLTDTYSHKWAGIALLVTP